MKPKDETADEIEKVFDNLILLTLGLGEVSKLCRLFGADSHDVSQMTHEVDLVECKPLERAVEALDFFREIVRRVKDGSADKGKPENEVGSSEDFVKNVFCHVIEREVEVMEALLREATQVDSPKGEVL